MKKIKLLSLLLAIVMLLSGCGADAPADDESKDDSPAYGSAEPDAAVTGTLIKNDNKFTLRYDPTNEMNPITGKSSDNMIVAGLMYESLFALDDQLMPQNVLCKTWSTTNGIDHYFDIVDYAVFSDGSPLTASDVAYSINKAYESNKYAGRFHNYVGAYVLDDDTVQVVLDTPDYSLPSLLDTAIIKYGTNDQEVPTGSGLYYMSGTRLLVNTYHKDAQNAPISVIYLSAFDTSAMTESFAEGKVDLVWDDPHDDTPISVRANQEERRYATTMFQYIGLNYSSPSLGDVRVRQAIQLAVDHAKIAADIYGNYASPSPLLINPDWGLYDASVEPKAPSNRANAASALLKQAGMQDFDKNGWLDFPDGLFQGGYYDVDLRFVVYEGDDKKVAAAKSVCDFLCGIGLKATCIELEWLDYLAALDDVTYDLYYAEVTIPANFDLYEIISPYGDLNYGAVDDMEYESLLNACRTAKTDSAKTAAAAKLCQYANENVPIIPVLYRQHRVHTTRGVVTGLAPSQTSVFNNLASLTINLG